MTYVPGAEGLFRQLMPFVEHSDNFAERWTLVLGEVARRSELMGLEAAVSSVWDDLMAGRL